jgi:hypothetical protein
MKHYDVQTLTYRKTLLKYLHTIKKQGGDLVKIHTSLCSAVSVALPSEHSQFTILCVSQQHCHVASVYTTLTHPTLTHDGHWLLSLITDKALLHSSTSGQEHNLCKGAAFPRNTQLNLS